MELSSLLYVTTLSGLVAKGMVVVEIIFFNLSRDLTNHVFKGLCDLMGWSFL